MEERNSNLFIFVFVFVFNSIPFYHFTILPPYNSFTFLEIIPPPKNYAIAPILFDIF